MNAPDELPNTKSKQLKDKSEMSTAFLFFSNSSHAGRRLVIKE